MQKKIIEVLEYQNGKLKSLRDKSNEIKNTIDVYTNLVSLLDAIANFDESTENSAQKKEQKLSQLKTFLSKYAEDQTTWYIKPLKDITDTPNPSPEQFKAIFGYCQKTKKISY